ncbi:MAG: phosphate-starvation-inducible PsiE family protein [Pontimonas sp.]
MANENNAAADNTGIVPKRLLDNIEDIVHAVLGLILLVVAIAAVGVTVWRVITIRPFFPNGMLEAINDVLFIVIILEILRTIVARFTDGFFQLSKFLVIGVIASVRHILSVGSSLTLNQGKTTEEFQRAILELGVNAGVVLALVFAILLVRRSQKDARAQSL